MPAIRRYAFLLFPALAAAAGYAGSGACRSCHAGHYTRQSRTAHFTALRSAQDHPLKPDWTRDSAWVARGSFRHRLTAGESAVEALTDDGRNLMRLTVEWAFGSGQQAVTFISRINEEAYLEHPLSYYPRLRQFAATPGHDDRSPSSIEAAAGLPYRTLDPQTGIIGCFECHSTGGVSRTSGNVLVPREPGVTCEACHGPGSAHAASAARTPGSAAASIDNPRRLSAAGLNAICGKCHRPPASDPGSIDWNYAWNVRHQPIYLSESRCFSASRGALTCLTCHAPHDPLERNSAFYNSRCATCHRADRHPPSLSCRTQEHSNCIDCHMPRVSPQTGLAFSNHRIGVYLSGGKLVPRKRPK